MTETFADPLESMCETATAVAAAGMKLPRCLHLASGS